MQITKLIVKIGGREELIIGCTDENPDVAALMRMATFLSVVVTIDAPQDDEVAGALGRLVFNKPRTEQTDSTDRISTLSKRIGEVGLMPRTVAALQTAGFTYIWEVAEKKDIEIQRLKNVGSKTYNDIRVTFRGLGVELGTSFSSVKEHLPQPPS
jgi:DNA-directed RNA polymerase alpha subunit